MLIMILTRNNCTNKERFLKIGMKIEPAHSWHGNNICLKLCCFSYKFRIVFMVQFDKDAHNPSAL